MIARRSGVDQEDLKPHWKSEKYQISQANYIFKDCTNQMKNANRVAIFLPYTSPQHS